MPNAISADVRCAWENTPSGNAPLIRLGPPGGVTLAIAELVTLGVPFDVPGAIADVLAELEPAAELHAPVRRAILIGAFIRVMA